MIRFYSNRIQRTQSYASQFALDSLLEPFIKKKISTIFSHKKMSLISIRYLSNYLVTQEKIPSTVFHKPRGRNKYTIDPNDSNKFRIIDIKSLQKDNQHEMTILSSLYNVNILNEKTRNILDNMIMHFLPHGYPSSIPSNYIDYAKWQFLGGTSSAICGVLSMQSLLYAVGLGAGSIPVAAALNWVIKDGLGQLGGVLYASLINHRFDADPKRWRMVSALCLDMATLLEVCTPLFPALFLPLASIANIGKNISWLSASATRAGIHYSFVRKENLADITAKAGSQTIAASVVGMGVGVIISPIVGASFLPVFTAFSIASSIHLFSVYKSLNYVALPTLNHQRLEFVTQYYLQHETLPSITQTQKEEIFLKTLFHGFQSKYATKFQLGLPIEKFVSCPQELNALISIFKHEKYLINIQQQKNNQRTINLILQENAKSQDVLRGYLHAHYLQQYVDQSSKNFIEFQPKENIIQQTYHQLTKKKDKDGKPSTCLMEEYYSSLSASSYHISSLLIEEINARYTIEPNNSIASSTFST